MKLGLTLDKNDFVTISKLLEDKNYTLNKIGLLGIIHACAVSPTISEIWLICIEKKSNEIDKKSIVTGS